ncbi:glycoside hydrolase family protein [Massilia agilis]|uniref:Lysozyme n=1 Tax=Massilia agilis TaxID=1811226 RepID=A0ABT2D5Z9_9BURK|nr:glycoside hydrolase family protein [Massilia agilis]MCS0806735.1 glycoside hydrolase family protein [Massilia agilis]
MAPKTLDSSARPNAQMKMSPDALSEMRNTEKVVLRYYNDLGRRKGNCTWGIGFKAHKGICTPAELKRMVSAPSVDVEYAKRVAEAERRVKVKVKVELSQAQFDGLVSFTYNTSNSANERVYRALNDHDFPQAARIISESVMVKDRNKWKLAPGLIPRRAKESAPFRVAADADNSAGRRE